MITEKDAKAIAEKESPGRIVQKIFDYKDDYICLLVPSDKEEAKKGYLDDFLAVNKKTGKTSGFQPFNHMDFLIQQNRKEAEEGIPLNSI